MRNTEWALAVLSMICASGWCQQPATPAQSPQTDSSPASVTPYKPPNPAATDKLVACPASFEHHPEVDGIYKIGDGVKPPVPTNHVQAQMTDEARRAAKQNPGGRFQDFSMVGLVVDQEGNPQEICIKKVAGYGLDQEAVKAVKKYRFRPATKNGQPVAVRIAVEVNFKTY